MRHRRRIGILGLVAAALTVALVFGRSAAENVRDTLPGTAGAEVAATRVRPTVPIRPPGARARETDPDAAVAGDDPAAGAFAPGFEREPATRAESNRALHAEDNVESIVLEAFRGGRRAPTLDLLGRDPEAPRDLLAWRVKRGRFAVVARGASEPDGSLRFPEVVAPRDGIEVVVTPTDSIPGLPGASEPRRLAPRDPQVPQAMLIARRAGAVAVRIFPREATGSVLLADSYGVVFASYPVPDGSLAAHRVIDVELSVGGSNAIVLLAHEFSDGRASEWSLLELPIPEAGEAAQDPAPARGR